jgi:hypothetical protein
MEVQVAEQQDNKNLNKRGMNNNLQNAEITARLSNELYI